MHTRTMRDMAEQSIQVLPETIAVDLPGTRMEVKNAAVSKGGIAKELAQLYWVGLQPRQTQPVGKAGDLGVAQGVTRQRDARSAAEIDRDRHAGGIEHARRAKRHRATPEGIACFG